MCIVTKQISQLKCKLLFVLCWSPLRVSWGWAVPPFLHQETSVSPIQISLFTLISASDHGQSVLDMTDHSLQSIY